MVVIIDGTIDRNDKSKTETDYFKHGEDEVR